MYHALVKRQVKQIIIFKTSTPSATPLLVPAFLANDSACHLSVCISFSLLRYCHQVFSPNGPLCSRTSSLVCSLEHRQGFACPAHVCTSAGIINLQNHHTLPGIYKSFYSQSSGIAHRLSRAILGIPILYYRLLDSTIYYSRLDTFMSTNNFINQSCLCLLPL